MGTVDVPQDRNPPELVTVSLMGLPSVAPVAASTEYILPDSFVKTSVLLILVTPAQPRAGVLLVHPVNTAVIMTAATIPKITFLAVIFKKLLRRFNRSGNRIVTTLVKRITPGDSFGS